MSAPATVATLAGRHRQILFGTDVLPADPRVSLIAGGTRKVYRVSAGPNHPAIIAKARVRAGPSDMDLSASDVTHEFDAQQEVWLRLQRACRHCRVPRPLLSLPAEGVMFMEEAPGRPFASLLRRWLIGAATLEEACRQATLCGSWLACFRDAGASMTWPQLPAPLRIERARARSRHHVYRLIGYAGSDLINVLVSGARRRLDAYGTNAGFTTRMESALARIFTRGAADLQGAVHGKFSPSDIFVHGDQVMVLDLEQTSTGSLYLDPAYFLYQVYMTTRWRPFGLDQRPAERLRTAFLSAGHLPLDEQVLDSVIAYYLVNSLRPGGGLAGHRARAYARRWLSDWLDRAS